MKPAKNKLNTSNKTKRKNHKNFEPQFMSLVEIQQSSSTINNRSICSDDYNLKDVNNPNDKTLEDCNDQYKKYVRRLIHC